ncbi:MAG: CpaE family protein [Bryobacteraceae bacterium]
MVAELKNLLASEARSLHVVQVPGYQELESVFPPAGGALPRICFLDVCTSRDRALALLPRLAEPPHQVPVVGLLFEDDPDLALRCLRIGAAGCLIHPFDSEQLHPVLSRIGYLDAAPQPGHRQGVIAVAPAKGSSGASTLACNLACQASRDGLRKVLLADMDPVAGTLDFMLKLKSAFSFADALAHAENLDGDIWRGLVCPYRGLDVLLSPENPLECESEAAAVASLVAYARRAYDLVVLDTGGPFSALGLQLLKLSDEILLVTTTEPGSIYGAKRVLSYLAENGLAAAQVRLVLSRWRRELGFEQADIETALGLPVYQVLPNDPQAVEEALLQGRPVASGSPFGKSLTELEARLFDQDPPRARPSSSKGFLGLFSKGA